MLRIFSPLKIRLLRPGLNANLGTKGQHATPRPPKPLPSPLTSYLLMLQHRHNFTFTTRLLISKSSTSVAAFELSRVGISNSTDTMAIHCHPFMTASTISFKKGYPTNRLRMRLQIYREPHHLTEAVTSLTYMRGLNLSQNKDYPELCGFYSFPFRQILG